MIALLQRVTEAWVRISNEPVASIGPGLLVLVGVEAGDGPEEARRLAQRTCHYRVFPDANGQMNLDVGAAGGAILAVPQFTLAADTQRGNRPGFSTAAPPGEAEPLFQEFAGAIRAHLGRVETGRFGADMSVGLVNQGPVTFWLQVRPPGSGTVR
ncbi:MAG: D-aminoacyl-tRNA deacylase [Steroidobacteraceae bacterium]